MKLFPRLLFLLPATLCLLTVTAQAQTQTQPSPATTASATPSIDSSAALQTIDPAKAAEIRKMLELTGTVKMTSQVLDQMINGLKVQNSSVPPEFWNRFEKEMNVQDLVEKMIPLYDKYYTLDDLKAVNAFYGSPAGQRMLAATPQIMHDSMIIGRDWSRDMGMKIAAELEKEKAAAATVTPSTPTATSAPATH